MAVAKEILILGPSGVGKTGLLAAVGQAPLVRGQQEGGLEIRAIPRSEKMTELFELFRKTITAGRLPLVATQSVDTYTFELQVRRAAIPAWVPYFGAPTCTFFTFVDGPGGALIPTPHEERDRVLEERYREQILTVARRASGFMLCVDASDTKQASAFFTYLPTLLARIGRDILPYKRVAVAMTKVDRYLSGQGREAHQRALRDDPCPWGRRLLTAAGYHALRQYCRDSQIGFCWTSAYGFIPDEGSANYDPHHDRLLTFDGDAATAMNYWSPFQVLDPFLFLANHRAPGVRVV